MLTPSQALALAQQRHQAGDPATAERLCRQALQSDPNSPAAHFFLGRALQALGRNDEAAASYGESLRLNPASAAAHNNLGDVLNELGRPAEAEAALRQALRRKPDFPEAHNNLGIALGGQGRFDEAAACFREALRLRPDYALAHNNLGNALKAMGQAREALACFEQALRLRPDGAEFHKNRGTTLLLLGDWERGWPEYEWRHRCKDEPPPAHPLPVWDGAPLAGRTILLSAERGLGDTIQFVRYAPLVKERGGTVLVECQAPLARLLAGCPGADRVLTAGGDVPIAADVYIPLLSLPAVFRTTPATVPARVPYLNTDAARADSWRRELAPLPGFKVGIVWQGNPRFPGDRWRSAPLAEFAPVAAVPRVRLFSLQKEEEGRRQLPPLADRFGITDLAPRLADFVDTAAVMKSLDLVITTDTAAVHLAGALGVPVWMATSWAADWRWLLGREDSPWYPNLRLFRQPAWGDWASVFARMAAALRAATDPGGRSSVSHRPAE